MNQLFLYSYFDLLSNFSAFLYKKKEEEKKNSKHTFVQYVLFKNFGSKHDKSVN